MKKKTSKSISQLSIGLRVNNAVIPSAKLSKIKGGFVVVDEIGGL